MSAVPNLRMRVICAIDQFARFRRCPWPLQVTTVTPSNSCFTHGSLYRAAMGAIVPHGRRESPSGGADGSCLRAANSAEGRATVHRRGPRRSVEVSELFYHTFTKMCAFRTCLPPSTHRPLAWQKHTLLHAWHTMIRQYLDSALEKESTPLLSQRSVHPTCC